VQRAGLRWLPLLILVLGGLAAWGLAQGRPNRETDALAVPEPAVFVVEALPRDVALWVRTHGSVEPAREIDLVAEVTGRVRLLAPALEPGGFFQSGELLVELERADAELAVERSEAALLRRESELHLAGARLARLRSLAARAVASTAQIEEAEHAERSARAGLREANVAREEARRQLARTRIRAPFVGRVRSKGVDGGEVAHGPRVTLRAPLAGRAVAWPARVVRVEGEVSPRTRMLHVVAQVEDPFGRGAQRGRPALAPGLFVEAEIAGRTFREVFVLPRAALRRPDRVITVDSDGRLRARRVEVLRVETERVIVGRGLEPGEKVCASAIGAMEGMRVRIVLASAESAPGAVAGLLP
jgi:hypothetical protein